MKIKDEDIGKANDYFQKLNGTFSLFNHFHAGMADKFGIIFSKKGEKEILVEFINCLYVQGPTSWENANLTCKVSNYEGREVFEVFDSGAGFKVIAGSGIRAENGKLYVTVHE